MAHLLCSSRSVTHRGLSVGHTVLLVLIHTRKKNKTALVISFLCFPEKLRGCACNFSCFIDVNRLFSPSYKRHLKTDFAKLLSHMGNFHSMAVLTTVKLTGFMCHLPSEAKRTWKRECSTWILWEWLQVSLTFEVLIPAFIIHVFFRLSLLKAVLCPSRQNGLLRKRTLYIY